VSGKLFKRAIIHIGTERTGSTSIQRMLFRHRDLLGRHGVFVPLSLVRSYEHFVGVANHIFAVLAFADLESFPNDLIPDDITSQNLDYAEIQKLICSSMVQKFRSAGPHPILVISAEHIHSRLRSTRSLKRLRATLSEYVEEFRIIVFLRPQIEMAISLGNLALRRGKGLRQIPLFEDNGWDQELGVRETYFDLQSMINRLLSVFGKEAIEPHIYGSGSAFDSRNVLLEAMGVRIALDKDEMSRENGSLSRVAQEALLFINKYTSLVPQAKREFFSGRVDSFSR
jgi:hypothetical protein